MRWLVLLALLVPGTAHADDPGRPVPTAVRSKLAGTVAHVALQYRLEFAKASRRQVALTLPARGVATAASVIVDGRRHSLALVRSDAAKRSYDATVDATGGRFRRWAVQLAHTEGGELWVDVAAAYGGSLTLEVELDAETCFVADQRYLQIPASWKATDRPVVRSSEHDRCSGERIEDDDERAWIAFAAPPGEQRIATLGGRLDVPHGHFARVELALASQLTSLAPDLYTVFVIDGSRSLSYSDQDLQARTILSYAKQAGASHVQIIAYARKAKPLLPGWELASSVQLAPALEALELANGSNLDAGLALASRLLAEVRGTRRIVVFSDQLVSDRVRALHDLQGTLPSGTLVHVLGFGVAPAPDALDSIARADDVLFADLARVTEGLAATVQQTEDRALDALKLVRPIELERVKLAAHGWTTAAFQRAEPTCSIDGTQRLREGAACTWWGTGGARDLELTGLLWNHRITREVALEPQPRMLARLLGDEDLGDATREVADAAHAINREWSLLAQWGGTAGYADLEIEAGVGLSGCGCASVGSFSTSSHCGGAVGSREPIEDQIERGIRACHLTGKLEISLELTRAEIVDVNVATPDRAARDCVTEAVWDVPLVLDQPPEHDHKTITLFAT